MLPEPEDSFVQRLWDRLGPWFFILAGLMTLITLFYIEENWRGKRAWEKCRRDLEAKGETFDWNTFIPGPVPDDKNIFRAPKMQQWFVKPGSGFAGPSSPFNLSRRPYLRPLVLANVKILPPNAQPSAETQDAVLRPGEPSAVRQQIQKLLQTAFGATAVGAQNDVLVSHMLDRSEPLNVLVLTETILKAQALGALFSTNAVDGQDVLATTRLRVEPAGSNSFRLVLKPGPYPAAEYLESTEGLVPDFDTVRSALTRPYARMDGDYRQPFMTPIPNFVTVRQLAQILSQRAQCYLLQGQPEAAWHELALVHDLCRVLHNPPSDKPLTLVAAMIDTAVTGLFVEVIADGLRLYAWREPQLVAIQQQLKGINLLPGLLESFKTERVGSCCLLETTSLSQLSAILRSGSSSAVLDPFNFVPRGWVYQNMVSRVRVDENLLNAFNLRSNVVLTRELQQLSMEYATVFNHFSPYTFLAAIMTPNCLRACQIIARNQTLVNEALIVCGLERYRMARGQYPATLEELVPQFVENLPHDLIGGRPLHYRRASDDRFSLYSVGWNEKDDGGVPGKGTVNDDDWVWQ
jgi:hypothetical protein